MKKTFYCLALVLTMFSMARAEVVRHVAEKLSAFRAVTVMDTVAVTSIENVFYYYSGNLYIGRSGYFIPLLSLDAGGGDIAEVRTAANSGLAGGSTFDVAILRINAMNTETETDTLANDTYYLLIQQDSDATAKRLSLDSLKIYTWDGLTLDDVEGGISNKHFSIADSAALASLIAGNAGEIAYSNGVNGVAYSSSFVWDEASKQLRINVSDSLANLLIGGGFAVLDTSGTVLFKVVPDTALINVDTWIDGDLDVTGTINEKTFETTLTDDASKVPTSAAVIAYGDANWAGGGGGSSVGSVVYPGLSIYNCHFPFSGPATRAIGQTMDYLVFDATNPDSVTWTGRISPTFDGSTDTLYANFIWESPAPDDIVIEVKVDAGANDGSVNYNTIAYGSANTDTLTGTMYKRYHSQLALLNDDSVDGGDFVTILLRRDTANAADDGSSNFNLLAFWLGKGVNE